jgi:hypothetical protein
MESIFTIGAPPASFAGPSSTVVNCVIVPFMLTELTKSTATIIQN